VGDGGHILVIDDDLGVRVTVQKILSRSGYEVMMAASGDEALQLAGEKSFDLALIDLIMPGMDGIETMRRLREASPETVAIMLTAHGTMESAIEALRLGAHDYLVKPCPEQALKLCVEKGMAKRRDQERQRTLMRQLTELTETVRDLASEEPKAPASPHPLLATEGVDQPQPEGVISIGDLTIDVGKHEVVLSDKPLDLTPIEFDLLVSLASHADRVRTSRELVQEIQGYECEEREAREIIRWHISRLRKKMGSQASCIETVWGIGYKFASSAGIAPE
jgi:DNA-binding response OmpR family regulator